jgi:hypothetical protein
MPNRDTHSKVSAVTGGNYAAYLAWGQPGPQVFAETTGGVLGGAAGGLLPDWIDVPNSPRHRAQAHSVAITGAAGYYLKEQILPWQSSLRLQAQAYSQMRQASVEPLTQLWYGFWEFLCYFLAGALAGLLGGYASHLALDSLTPSSLPVLC